MSLCRAALCGETGQLQVRSLTEHHGHVALLHAGLQQQRRDVDGDCSQARLQAAGQGVHQQQLLTLHLHLLQCVGWSSENNEDNRASVKCLPVSI